MIQNTYHVDLLPCIHSTASSSMLFLFSFIPTTPYPSPILQSIYYPGFPAYHTGVCCSITRASEGCLLEVLDLMFMYTKSLNLLPNSYLSIYIYLCTELHKLSNTCKLYCRTHPKYLLKLYGEIHTRILPNARRIYKY